MFADLFAGTGAVAKAFKPTARKIIVNDLEAYSYVLLRNAIGNHQPLDVSEQLAFLNALPGEDGFITRHYGEGESGRLYFSRANAQRIDAIRRQLAQWRARSQLSEDAYYALLASLLEAADRVANTTAQYGAFLKQLKVTARQKLHLRPVPFALTAAQHEVYQQDANTLTGAIAGDVLYLDPPYNARQYGANYHLLNTIALYDEFVPQGKTGLRSYNRSHYSSRRTVASALEDLIRRADFEYVFLSYNNEGLLDQVQVQEVLAAYGRYQVGSTTHPRYQSHKSDAHGHRVSRTTEYLHVLHKEARASRGRTSSRAAAELGSGRDTAQRAPPHSKRQPEKVFPACALPQRRGEGRRLSGNPTGRSVQLVEGAYE